MTRSKTLGVALLLAVGMMCSAQQSDVVFRANGAGLWKEAGQKSELVVIAELRHAKSDEVTLTIRPINGIPRRLSGRVQEESDSSYTITITRSEKLHASGIVHIENGAAGSLEFLIGFVTVNGRNVVFQFSKRRPLKRNTLALGRGTITLGDAVQDIRALSILTPMAAETRVTLLCSSGKVIHLAAKSPATRADHGDAQFSISEVDGVVATGSMTVQRDRATSQVTEVEGAGTVADKSFTLEFETAD